MPDQAEKGKRNYRCTSRETKRQDTLIRIGAVQIGGPELVVIAGPSAVESEPQIIACARQVKECGGQILCGGCFQPRLAPEGFQGRGWEGLEWLSRAGRQYDLPVATEVLAPTDVERVAERADVLVIGEQNMQNFPLLSEVGGLHQPVILRRGMSASLEQLLFAAEFIMARGNQQVMLCEHGISTFETTTRNTLDLGGISILKKQTHLPIVVDPSHAAGQRDLVLPLALAARAVGTHALWIEIHPAPERALSDGLRALGFPEFRELVSQLFG